MFGPVEFEEDAQRGFEEGSKPFTVDPALGVGRYRNEPVVHETQYLDGPSVAIDDQELAHADFFIKRDFFVRFVPWRPYFEDDIGSLIDVTVFFLE
jgi:hypothetical protein